MKYLENLTLTLNDEVEAAININIERDWMSPDSGNETAGWFASSPETGPIWGRTKVEALGGLLQEYAYIARGGVRK